MSASIRAERMTRELNNRLLSAVSALLFQMFLLPYVAQWLHFAIIRISGGFVEGGDVLWAVVVVSLHAVVILVYLNFFVTLYTAFSTEIDRKLFGIAVALGIVSPIISLAFGLLFSVIPLEGSALFVALGIFGHILIWSTAIAHCILLVKSMSEILPLRAQAWIRFSVVFKAACLALSIVHLSVPFMTAAGNEYMMDYTGGFMDIPMHWLWLLWLFASPLLLVILDLFVYCAVLVYAFWNLSKRVKFQSELTVYEQYIKAKSEASE